MVSCFNSSRVVFILLVITIVFLTSCFNESNPFSVSSCKIILISFSSLLRSPPATTARSTTYQQQSAANKGLKKKVLRSLPKLVYSEEFAENFTECAICLAEFSAGDEVRVLPQCGHGFHVGCIDTWFGSHSSCPSCRHILGAAARCHKCGGLPPSSAAGETSTSMEERRKEREEHNDTFLP